MLWKPFELSSGLWFIRWITLSSFWTAGAWLSNLLLKHFTLIGASTKLTRAYHLWFLAIVNIPNFHGCLFHMLEQTLPKLIGSTEGEVSCCWKASGHWNLQSWQHIVITCCTLHNFCLQEKEIFLDEWWPTDDEDNQSKVLNDNWGFDIDTTQNLFFFF